MHHVLHPPPSNDIALTHVYTYANKTVREKKRRSVAAARHKRRHARHMTAKASHETRRGIKRIYYARAREREREHVVLFIVADEYCCCRRAPSSFISIDAMMAFIIFFACAMGG